MATLRVRVLVVAVALLAAGCGAAPASGPVGAGAATTRSAAARPVPPGPPSAGAPAPPSAVPPAPPSAGALAPAGTSTVTSPPAGTPRGSRRPAPSPEPAAGPASSQVGEAKLYGITCGQSEAQVAASGAPRVRRGSATIYAGAQQVGGDNQDPRVVRFDGGRRTWCRDDLETSGDDGRAYGLAWSGDVLVAVFSAVGTQGEPSGDLRRFTAAGWLSSYSDAAPLGGGGAKAAAVVRLDPVTGAGLPGNGTWITADRGGRVNSATVTALASTAAGIRVTVDSAYLPRGAGRSAMTCSGSSPFRVTYTFDRSLRSVTAVASPTCR